MALGGDELKEKDIKTDQILLKKFHIELFSIIMTLFSPGRYDLKADIFILLCVEHLLDKLP